MLKLLIVDDSKWTREGLSQVIDWRSLNIEIVDTCSNAAKALHILLEKHIDILITDIKMAGMDGLELAEYVHLHYPDIKIVLISAYKEFDYAFKAVQLGVSGYVLKPIIPEDMLKTIRSILEDKASVSTPAKVPDMENGSSSSTDLLPKNSKKIISSAKDYVNKHISDKNLNLRQASLDLHINYYYLSKSFKEDEGISFTEYLTNRRLQIASNLLSATTLHIYEVCEQIGMEPKNFHRLFRKKYHMSPQEYRRSHNCSPDTN